MSLESELKAAQAEMAARFNEAADVSAEARAIPQQASEPAQPIDLEQLPLAQLVRLLADQMSPAGDDFLQPHSVGTDSLALPIHGPYSVASGTLAATGNETTVTLTHNLNTTVVGCFGGMQDGHFATEIGWRWAVTNSNTVTITFHSLGPDANISGTLVAFLATT